MNGRKGMQDRKALGLCMSIWVTLVILWPTINNGWTNWDDQFYVLHNPLIRDISINWLQETFSTLQVQGIYHPLTILSYTLDYAIAGLEPDVYHTTNLVLHAFNVGLVFWFIYLLSGSTNIATWTAMLFGIHPMHLESVAWISARKDVLYTVFFMSGLISYWYYLQGGKRQLSVYLLCLLWFILSLLAKGMAVTFPLLLFCLDFLLNRQLKITVILEKIPFLLLSLGFGILAVITEQKGAALAELHQYDYGESIVVAFYTITVYVIKAFMPFHLSAFHPYPNLGEEAIPWFYYVAVIPLGSLLYLVYRVGSRYREVAFGAAFFLVSILPVSQIVPVGSAVLAERYTYVAYIGLFFLMGLAWNQWTKRQWGDQRPYRTFVVCLCSGWLLLMGWIPHDRTDVWQNGETLWSDVIEKYPNDYFAYGNRGNYRLSVDNRDGAMADFNQSLHLNPRFFEGYNNRGMVYLNARDYRRARADFDQAIEINAQYAKAWLNRAVVSMMQGDYAQALSDLDRTLQLAPEFPQAFHTRGVLYRQMRKFDAAIRDLSTAINLASEHAVLYKDRGTVYYLSQHPEAAIEDFSRAIALMPDDGEAYFRRSVAYFGHNRTEEALRDAHRAQQLNFPVDDAYFKGLQP